MSYILRLLAAFLFTIAILLALGPTMGNAPRGDTVRESIGTVRGVDRPTIPMSGLGDVMCPDVYFEYGGTEYSNAFCGTLLKDGDKVRVRYVDGKPFTAAVVTRTGFSLTALTKIFYSLPIAAVGTALLVAARALEPKTKSKAVAVSRLRRLGKIAGYCAVIVLGLMMAFFYIVLSPAELIRWIY